MLALTAVLGGLTLAPGTASATTGGGCGPTYPMSYPAPGASYSCISASGGYLWPDAYISRNDWGRCLDLNLYIHYSSGVSLFLGSFRTWGTGHFGPVRSGRGSSGSAFTTSNIYACGGPAVGFSESNIIYY
jgi:hypothetical protein